MARRNRPVTFGTYLMLAITAITVGLAAWIFPRIAGNLEDISIDTAALIKALAATAPPDSIPYVVYSPPAQTEEPPPIVTPEPAPLSKNVSFGITGQIWLDKSIRNSGQTIDGVYNYDDIFTSITPYMQKPDIMMVTLETAISTNGQYDTYKAPPELLTSLKKAGVDIINMSTERILDAGITGLVDTRTLAEQQGFDVVGANRSEDESRLPLTFEVNGVKVAVLSYTFGLSTVGVKVGTAEQRAYSVNLLDESRVIREVAQAREQGANIVLVNAHWGKRANTKASTDITRFVDAVINCGADAILGSHPTSVHKLERRTVACVDGVTRDVLVAYSLGDFLVGERSETADIIGMMLNLDFTLPNGETSARLTGASYMPTWLMRYDDDKYYYRIIPAGTTTQPTEMTNTTYRTMRRAYEDLIKKLGQDAAQSVEE